MPGFSIFLLYAAPIVGMVIGGVFAYKLIIKNAGRGVRRWFMPKTNRKHKQRLLEQYDKELATNTVYRKNASRRYVPAKLNRLQGLLQKLGLRNYYPKPLSQRQRNVRIKRARDLANYLDQKHVAYSAPYVTSYAGTAPKKGTGSRKEDHAPERYSAKEFNKVKRQVVWAPDSSVLLTCSPAAKKTFESYKSNMASTNSKLQQNKLHIFTNVTSVEPAEVLNSPNKLAFYATGSEMLNNMLEKTGDDVYPVTISQTIVKKGKAEEESYICRSKEELEKVQDLYEKTFKTILTKEESSEKGEGPEPK